MEIAIRRAGSKWELRATEPYDREKQLQELLGDQPDLIPLHHLGDQVLNPCVAVRELPLRPAGMLDLLAVDEAGNLTLVECKLDANAESKRTVVAQVVEYASALWRMEYDDLDLLVRERSGSSLADLVRAKVGDDDEWAAEDFRTGVERHLKAGDFRLIVAVDQVNDRLRAMIEYLNEAGPSAMSLHLLEVRRFVSGETEVLIPQLHGSAPTTPMRAGTGQKTNRDSFLAGCDEYGRNFFSALFSAADASGVMVDWGDVGFTLALYDGDARVPVLRGYPAASAKGQRLVLQVVLWKERLPQQIAELLEYRLSELPGAPGRFENKKLVLKPIDGRFRVDHARVIVETLTEASRVLGDG